MAEGFIEVTVRRRKRGRSSERRKTRVVLADGTRLEFGDQVPGDLIRSVIVAVSSRRARRC